MIEQSGGRLSANITKFHAAEKLWLGLPHTPILLAALSALADSNGQHFYILD